MEFFINDKNDGFVQQLIIDAQYLLGNPPNGLIYSIVSLGSFSYGTATPWSDLEFAILINKNNDEYKEYFRNLTNVLYILVLEFREFPLRDIGINALRGWFWDYVSCPGFNFDGNYEHACKTPLGRKKYNKPDYELICTPDEMIKFQSANKWYDSDPHLVQSLMTVSLIIGDQKLLDDYRSKLLTIDSNIIQQRSIKLLKDDISKYKLHDTTYTEIDDIKKKLYRIVDRIIHALANYYNIIALPGQKTITMWDILRSKLIDMISEDLLEALSIACEFRLLGYVEPIHNINNHHLLQHYYRLMSKIQLYIETLINK